MLTVMGLLVLFVSSLSATALFLSAVALIVCWPFFTLAVVQPVVTGTVAPAATGRVPTRLITVLPSSKNSVFDAAAFVLPWFLMVAVSVTFSPWLACCLLAATADTLRSGRG